MTISVNDWSMYLEQNITPATFQIFAKITNLQNNENVQTLMTLLYHNQLNLVDLINIELFDDKAIEDLLEDRARLLQPLLSTTVNAFPSNTYLLGTTEVPTSLGVLMKEYNAFLSNSVISNLELGGEIFPPIYTEFGLEKGSAYSNYADYLADFTDKVLTPLLVEYNVADISEIFPQLTIDSVLTTEETEYLTQTYDLLFSMIQSSFTNAKLNKLLVWTEEKPSVFSDNIRLFNELLNLKQFTKVIEVQLMNKILWLADRNSGTFTEEDVEGLKTELFSFTMGNAPISDSLSYVIFYWTMITTIEQNSNLPVSANFLYEYKKFYDLIEAFRVIYFKLSDSIVRKLHVKVN